jgi:predicted esterase
VRDDVVSLGHGRALRDRLNAAGLSVEYREYDANHTITEPMALDAAQWLTRRLA